MTLSLRTLSMANCSWLKFLSALVLMPLVGCGQVDVPDLNATPWQSLQVEFCTETNAKEVWETRNSEKLALLQSAFFVQAIVPLDHVVASHNHKITVLQQAAEVGQKAQGWVLVIKRDQQHVAFYNVSQPEQSYQAEVDAMFYRTLNTLLKSHMNSMLDIFRKCEMPQ